MLAYAAPLHVHIGAGALGLGLTCWATRRAGFEVAVFNRRSSSDIRNNLLRSSRSFDVSYPDGTTSDRIDIHSFAYLDEPDLLGLLCDPRCVLLTTALKEYGLREVVPVLRQTLLQRAASGQIQPLLFVACENAISSSKALDLILEGLSSQDTKTIRSTVEPADCMVDRICNKPVIDNGVVAMSCEQFADWCIQDSAFVQSVFALAKSSSGSSIQLVPNLAPYVVRKKWIVNSLHLSSALRCLAENEILIHKHLQRHTAARQLFHALADEFGTIFNYWAALPAQVGTFKQTDLDLYYDAVKRRIMNHPQRVSDAMTRFKKDQLLEFLKDFFRKIVDPYLFYSAESGKPLFHVPRLVAQVNEMIAKEQFL